MVLADSDQQESKMLSRKWEEVMASYHKPEIHYDFIDLCFVNDKVAYGCEKYAKILEVQPSDETAQSMVKLFEVLAESEMPFHAESPQTQFRRFGVFSLGYALSGFMIVSGFLLPQGGWGLLLAGLGLLLVLLRLRFRTSI